MIQLTRPEVSVEGRLWSLSTPYTLGGRLHGTATGIGLDGTDGLRTDSADARLSGPSFLSFVYPGDNWAIAFYVHQTANFEALSETQGFFTDAGVRDDDDERTDLTLVPRFVDIRSETDLNGVSYGLAGALRVADNFSLGGGVALMNARWDQRVEFYVPVPATLPDGLFGLNQYAAAGQFVVNTARMDSTDWTFNGGFLWRPQTRWSIGGFSRLGALFELSGEDRAGPAFDLVPSELVLPRTAEGVVGFPHVFGFGTAFTSESGALTVGFQWDHVGYSRLVDTFELNPIASSDDVTLSNANEFHTGLEYVFINRSPLVALRLGAWFDPDHRFRCINDTDLFCQATFRAGDDEWHVAAGLGVAFVPFQLDVGVDFSEVVDTLSISAIFSF